MRTFSARFDCTKWMAEQCQSLIIKSQTLVRITRDRKIWRATINPYPEEKQQIKDKNIPA